MSWFRLFIINWKFHWNEFIQIEFDSILKAQIKVESKLPCANISQFHSSKLYKIKFISFQYLLDEIMNFFYIFFPNSRRSRAPTKRIPQGPLERHLSRSEGETGSRLGLGRSGRRRRTRRQGSRHPRMGRRVRTICRERYLVSILLINWAFYFNI
jgi:hypothetical protein